jgi:hypothetical protein
MMKRKENMHKWKYLFVSYTVDSHGRSSLANISDVRLKDLVGSSSLEDAANLLGEQGWELVSHNYVVSPATQVLLAARHMAFKRPTSDDNR